jgi:hypothetical protein
VLAVLVTIIQFLEHLQIILEEVEAGRILEAGALQIGLAAQQEMIVLVLEEDLQIQQQAMEVAEQPIAEVLVVGLDLMVAVGVEMAATEVAELWLSAI